MFSRCDTRVDGEVGVDHGTLKSERDRIDDNSVYSVVKRVETR